MHMNHPERGDVLMLPNGELVVYDTITHSVRRSDGSSLLTLPVSTIKHDVLLVGSLEAAFAGFVKLCAPSPFSEGVDRYLVCDHHKIHHATLFTFREAAEDWIKASWGGAGNPNYWVATIRVLSPARPWDYADGRAGP